MKWALLVSLLLVIPAIIFAAITTVNRSPETLLTPIVVDATTEFSPSPNVVFTDANTGYMFYIGGTTYSTQLYGITYNKTTDGGLTWSKQITIPSPSIEQWANVAVWYDKWTPGDTGTKIHIAATEAVSDDVWYISLDTTDDSLDADSWVSAIAGTRYDVSADGGVGITKSTDSNLFITGCGTFGSAQCPVYKSTDGNTWSNTSFSAASGLSDGDRIQLLPLTSGDVLAILQDTSEDKVISLEYDEGTDTWGNEQTIDASWVENALYDATWGASLNTATNNIYLAGMNEINSVTGDLEAYKFTESSRTWSVLSEIVSDRNEILQGTMAVDPATNYLYAVFVSCTPIEDACSIRYKTSTDDGATWSVPIQISDRPDDIKYVRTSFTAEEKLYVDWYNDDVNIIMGNPISTTVAPFSDYTIDGSAFTATGLGSQSPNTVFINEMDGYVFYVDSTSDIVYRKSFDGGYEWRDPVTLAPDKAWTNVAIWYDKWTPGDTGTKIHIVAVETATDDVWYYSLDVSDDSLDAQGWVATILGTVITAADDGPPSITKSSDGYLFISACGVLTSDTCVVAKSIDGDGDVWSDTSFDTVTVTDNKDQLQILPISGGDILGIFQDMSANTVYSLEYDEATDAWTNKQSIDAWAENTSFDFTWGAATASTTDDVYLVGPNALLSTTGDMMAYKFTDGTRAWSTLTPVVEDDDQILQGTIAVNPSNGDLFAVYVKGDHPYDVHTNSAFGANVYMKSSDDDGVTWSGATQLNSFSSDIRNVSRDMQASYGTLFATWFNVNYVDILGRRVSTVSPNATNIPREQLVGESVIIDATDEYNPAPNVVFIDANVGYMFFIGGTLYHTGTYEVSYRKTTDGGVHWGSQIEIASFGMDGPANVAVWYDQWTPGDVGTKIHLVAEEALTDDVWYNSLDTSDDSYDADGWISAIAGTVYTIDTDGGVGITKSTDGNLFITGCGTFGTPSCPVYKSIDGGDTWGNTSFSAASGLDNDDVIQLLPLTGGDILAILQDITADKVLSVEYDEATDSWGNEQTIDVSWVENALYDTTWGASLNTATNNIYLAGMNEIDSSTGDLEAYKFTEATRTWTTLTPIVSNSPRVLQGIMVVDPATDDLYAPYIKCPTLQDDCSIVYRKSTDDGVTWSEPVQISDTPDDIKTVRSSLTAENRLYVDWLNDDYNIIFGNSISLSDTYSDYTINGSVLSPINQRNPAPNVVFTDADTGYIFYVESTSDVVYRKTTDGGYSWADINILSPDKTWTDVAVWYDQWTPGDSGTKIHLVATETVTDDVWYYSLDTSDDSLDAQGWVAAILGTVATVAADGAPSITKSSDGYLFLASCGILTSDTCVVAKSIDGDGDTWSDTSFDTVTVTDNLDQMQILPLTGGDILAIFQDMSTNNVSSLEYDEVTDSWENEQIIDPSWIENANFDVMWGASLNTATNNIYLAGMNAINSATGDLEAYKFTESSRTWDTLAEVVTDNDDTMQGTVAINSSTGEIFVAYVQATTSDAANAYDSIVYVKTSDDDGATWSSAYKASVYPTDVRNVRTNFNAQYGLFVDWFNVNYSDLLGRMVDDGAGATPVYSITITSDGIIEYGAVDLSTATTTINGFTQTAQNDGNSTEQLKVKSSDASGGTGWTLASSIASDQFTHEFSTTTGSTWLLMPDSSTYVTADSAVATSASVNFDFRLTAPSAITDYQEKSITITVLAVAP